MTGTLQWNVTILKLAEENGVFGTNSDYYQLLEQFFLTETNLDKLIMIWLWHNFQYYNNTIMITLLQ